MAMLLDGMERVQHLSSPCLSHVRQTWNSERRKELASGGGQPWKLEFVFCVRVEGSLVRRTPQEQGSNTLKPETLRSPRRASWSRYFGLGVDGGFGIRLLFRALDDFFEETFDTRICVMLVAVLPVFACPT